jgi:hypothetical protein
MVVTSAPSVVSTSWTMEGTEGGTTTTMGYSVPVRRRELSRTRVDNRLAAELSPP